MKRYKVLPYRIAIDFIKAIPMVILQETKIFVIDDCKKHNYNEDRYDVTISYYLFGKLVKQKKYSTLWRFNNRSR